MIFALDFDGTFTADPELWTDWIRVAEYRGHTVFCVTFRPLNHMQKVYDTIGSVIDPSRCISTGGMYKKQYTEQNGIHVDVWIDDNPEMIVTAEEVDYWHTHLKF